MNVGDYVEHKYLGIGKVRSVSEDGYATIKFVKNTIRFRVDDPNLTTPDPADTPAVKIPSRGTLPEPTVSPDGKYKLWDRPRGYVAELLNQDQDIQGRITFKKKSLPEEEQQELFIWAQKFLTMEPGFKQLALDVLGAMGGGKIAIEFLWQIWRWSPNLLESMIPVLKHQHFRAIEREKNFETVK